MIRAFSRARKGTNACAIAIIGAAGRSVPPGDIFGDAIEMQMMLYRHRLGL
jgi:hypothetical protein